MTTKLDRQRATAQMTQCPCGNIAIRGLNQCGACMAADDHHETQVQALADCTSLDELKEFIAEYLMNS